uniref:interleukin-15 receptor subunit alpha-like isoform X5 n=1 Tax=Pristiophorus japonicus TaxID=55135 RepID=UPI00398EDC50
MARINQVLFLWSIFQATLAFKGSCSKPNFNVENVDMSEINDTNFEVGRRLRLKCQSGYRRMAGTSNLIRCQNNSELVKWSEPNLKCIGTGGTQPPVASTPSMETPKDLTPTVHDAPAMTSLATSVESTALATSVEPTSVEPTTSATNAGPLSDHYTTSTMDITVTSESPLSAATTTLATAAVESTTLTATTRSLSGHNRPSSVPPVITDTTGTEPITTRKALAETTVNSSTATEAASNVNATIGTTDINPTATAGRKIGIIVGTSTGSFFIVTLCILFLVWLFLFKKRISCIRRQDDEHESAPMAPIEIQTVTNMNETEPLQQETES